MEKGPFISEDDFARMIGMLPDNVGLLIDTEGGDLRVTRVLESDLVALSKRDDLFHVISFQARPGSNEYFNVLEQSWFTPNSALNYEFQYRVYRWNGLLFCIASVPLAKKQFCYDAAKIMNMRLADGVPHMFVGAMAQFATRKFPYPEIPVVIFPLSNANTFTLENEKGSPIYEGRADEVTAESERKRQELEEQVKRAHN